MKKLFALVSAVIMTLSCPAILPVTESVITADGAYVTASAKSIASSKVTLSNSVYTYTGTARKPTVTVKLGSKVLTKGTDYTVKYTNSVNIGTATVTITGKGDYKGTIKKTYSIQAVRKVSSVTVTPKTSTKLAVSWKSVPSAGGYYLQQYNTSTGKYENVVKTTKTSYTVTGLKAGKSYKFRVCAYRKISSKTYKSYSSAYSKKTYTKAEYYQVRVLSLVNAQRKKYGLSNLKANAVLNSIATQRAIETKSQFAHNYNGRTAGDLMDSANYEWWSWGENIAYGQVTPEDVVEAWMNSEGHRKNILNSKFGRLGVGYYYSNGTAYWVQVFSD